MYKYILPTIICALLLLNSCSEYISNQNGAVSSTSRIASNVGIEILKKGGNAFDAIVATGFALAVTSPANGNLGGGGFLIARTSGGEIISLDFREKAPADSFEEMFLDDQKKYDKNKAWFSHSSTGVPGTVNGLITIFNDYGSGKFTLQEIIRPALDLAENGFPLEEGAAEGFDANKKYFVQDEGSSALFVKNINNQVSDLLDSFNNGEINQVEFENMIENIDEWSAGDIFIQKDLAETLKRISSDGMDGFYGGETARLIVKEMNQNAGLITLNDLQEYHSVYREPIIGTYNNHTIVSMGPPSSGGILLVQMLNMLENFDIKNIDRNSANFVHIMTEVQRLAYADRSIHLGDPDFWDNPIDMLTSKEYANSRLRLISLENATPSDQIAAGSTSRESMETTHYSVMDKYGNTAGITTTINFSYGNKKIVDGAGFLLNNEMDDFSPAPNTPNAFGLLGDKANAVAPYKRPLSSMSPTLVINKEGETILTIGAAGGSRIITAVLQIIISVVDHGLNIQEAIDFPRTHSQWKPDFIFSEKNALTEDTKKELENLNHKFYEDIAPGGTPYLARTHGIEKKEGRFIAGADKRGKQNGNEAITY